MNDILELLVVVIVGVTTVTAIYKLLPFRKWDNKKPKFVLFPKYLAKSYKTEQEIQAVLEAIEFKRNDSGTYSRGKVYGDFSAKTIKLTVELDKGKNQIKVYASFFGVLFDTGDLWQVTSDIVNG